MINGIQSQTNDGQIEKYCYINNPDKCVTYGGLSQWDEAMQSIQLPGLKGFAQMVGIFLPIMNGKNYLISWEEQILLEIN